MNKNNNELNVYKEALHNLQEVLQTKTFWKIQGLNFYLIVGKIVSFVMLSLSLIAVVSITSQGLHLSDFQKGSVLNITIFVVVVLWKFINLFKNIHNGDDGSVEFLRAILGILAWAFIICSAFSINLTDYKAYFDLLLHWFVLFILFDLTKRSIFRKLTRDIITGEKSDWVRNINQKVIDKYEYGSLISSEIIETYKVKYSTVNLVSKLKKEFFISEKIEVTDFVKSSLKSECLKDKK